MKTNRRVWGVIMLCFTTFLVVGLFALPTRPATAAEALKQQELVDKARVTFDIFMADPDMTWLQRHMGDAKGLLIVPSLVKAGFVWGGSGGKGVLLGRDEKTGEWSEPAFYSMGSVSWGLQIGVQKAEVIMLVRSQRGMESLYRSSVKLGGDTSVAAGPVGVGAAIRNVTADIISFTRAKGAFAGLSLEGAVVKTSNKSNSAYYGKSVRPVDILVRRDASNPQSAELRRALTKASRAAQKEPISQTEGHYYEVRRGDTIYGIAKKHGLSVDELCSLNNITKDQTIYPGQKILVTPGG